jgi:hypothetical protein
MWNKVDKVMEHNFNGSEFWCGIKGHKIINFSGSEWLCSCGLIGYGDADFTLHLEQVRKRVRS